MSDASTTESHATMGIPGSAGALSPAGTVLPPITKVIVAIHGIGSQRRSSTIRAVARRFGDRSCPPLPVMPLGFFYIGKAGQVHVSRLDAEPTDPLASIGFAEVFWADIPRAVVKEEDTLEETKAWASSVVSRAHALYLRNVQERQLLPEDFMLGAGVVEEIIETVAVMENLLTVAEKAGVFKFDLAPLLRDYVGDVQLVTDFKFYRDRIVYRFHDAMAQIVERFKQEFPGSPEIYVVAHSEGTVVSFLGLLQALAKPTVADPMNPSSEKSTDWIQYVRGFMTIGSPIDKHLALWPKLWEKLDIRAQMDDAGRIVLPPGGGTARPVLQGKIKWRNYYDFGDPIGFKLDTAIEFLQLQGCQAFEFDTLKHDFGFSRYWLPGKAHNDYWNDTEVFSHFIDDVVLPPPKRKAPAQVPRSLVGRGIVSTALPYALTALLHVTAVFVLLKALTAFLGSNEGNTSVLQPDFARQVFLLGLLLLSVTIAARLPRLVRKGDLRWLALALGALTVGIAACAIYLPDDVAGFVGEAFSLSAPAKLSPQQLGLWALAVGSVIVAASGWLAPRRPTFGRRILLASGAVMILFIIMGRLFDPSLAEPVWPAVLAGVAFLYLWWLGILIFDLAFIWHRYIRHSVAVDVLADWHRGRDARPKSWFKGTPNTVRGQRAGDQPQSQGIREPGAKIG